MKFIDSTESNLEEEQRERERGKSERDRAQASVRRGKSNSTVRDMNRMSG